MVLARTSGALTVLGVQDLTNMLGDSTEFLEGVPYISQCFQKGFFGVECDSVVRGRKPSFMEESTGEDNDVQSEVESDDEDDNWLFLGTRSAAVLACYVTSPEELSNRKILLEE